MNAKRKIYAIQDHQLLLSDVGVSLFSIFSAQVMLALMQLSLIYIYVQVLKSWWSCTEWVFGSLDFLHDENTLGSVFTISTTKKNKLMKAWRISLTCFRWGERHVHLFVLWKWLLILFLQQQEDRRGCDYVISDVSGGGARYMAAGPPPPSWSQKLRTPIIFFYIKFRYIFTYYPLKIKNKFFLIF